MSGDLFALLVETLGIMRLHLTRLNVLASVQPTYPRSARDVFGVRPLYNVECIGGGARMSCYNQHSARYEDNSIWRASSFSL